MTFVWLFGALVRVCAIDYDPQDFFGTWLYMERYLKKCFMGGPRRGMVDLTSGLWLDPPKTRFGGTLGTRTQRLRLVITVILDVFGMN